MRTEPWGQKQDGDYTMSLIMPLWLLFITKLYIVGFDEGPQHCMQFSPEIEVITLPSARLLLIRDIFTLHYKLSSALLSARNPENHSFVSILREFGDREPHQKDHSVQNSLGKWKHFSSCLSL